MSLYTGLIDRYREYLPFTPDINAVTLHEGNTPLIPLRNFLTENPQAISLYVKYEGLNPTCSFKDRGMTVAVTQAVADDAKAIICASTGNTSAAAAAYAARAGLECIVLIPEGKIALGKLAQARMHGATVIQIKGNFDQGLQLVRDIGETMPITIVNSINPYRLQGQKTAAFEIVDALGQAPDYHCLPVGNAGNISAYWMGYTEYEQLGKSSLPKMIGYQAAGAAPLVHGEKVTAPETVATAIRIGDPASTELALKARDESEGWIDLVTDEEILQAQREIAERDGIFCEPASAASLAGVKKALAEDKIAAGSTIVCTLTGHGLKDPELAIKQASKPIHSVAGELSEIQTIIATAIAGV